MEKPGCVCRTERGNMTRIYGVKKDLVSINQQQEIAHSQVAKLYLSELHTNYKNVMFYTCQTEKDLLQIAVLSFG